MEVMIKQMVHPMNELEAINTMMIAIGDQPIDSLEQVEGIPEVTVARTILTQTSRQVQSSGFYFNTDHNYPLQADVEGFVYLPLNTVKVTSSDKVNDIVVRGNRLYNRKNHSFEFKPDAKIHVDLVRALDFNELPQVAKDYITIKAARVFQSRVIGAESLHQFTAKDEMDAYILFYREEIDIQDLNMLENSSISQMLRRF